MKRIYLLLILLFCLTGCEATYELNIKDDVFSERYEVDNFESNTWSQNNYKELIDNNYNTNLPVNHEIPGFMEDYSIKSGYEYYDKKLINEKENYGIILNHNYNYKDYKKSTLLLEGFNDVVINDGSSIIISTGNLNQIFDNYSDFNKLTVIISSDYSCSNNNADEVDNNKYIWFFTKNEKKKININFDTNTKVSSINKIDIDFSKGNTLIYVLIGIGVLIIVFGLYIFVKVKNSDK